MVLRSHDQQEPEGEGTTRGDRPPYRTLLTAGDGAHFLSGPIFWVSQLRPTRA
jgi:hypothetical protein